VGHNGVPLGPIAVKTHMTMVVTVAKSSGQSPRLAQAAKGRTRTVDPAPKSRRRIWLTSVLLLAAASGISSGCDTLAKLKHSLRSDDLATLRLEVQPQSGLSIILDGTPVATQSPYSQGALAPGAHRLEIRAPGYYPFAVPFELRPGEVLVLPIALRPRPLRHSYDRSLPPSGG
jgi:hypothetical protein